MVFRVFSSSVAMKGRVACEMGQNELIITELVLRNILTNLQPAEIAALLSSLVFQAKTDNEPTVTENLKKMMAKFVEVDEDIHQVEAKFNVGRADETVEKDRLNFGLIEVVYEWARNKVGSTIPRFIHPQLLLFSALRRNHAVDRHQGRRDRPLHPATPRNTSRCQGRCENHRRSSAAQQDGRSFERHQTRHRLRCFPLHVVGCLDNHRW
jgi:hypothetical protein